MGITRHYVGKSMSSLISQSDIDLALISSFLVEEGRESEASSITHFHTVMSSAADPADVLPRGLWISCISYQYCIPYLGEDFRNR